MLEWFLTGFSVGTGFFAALAGAILALVLVVWLGIIGFVFIVGAMDRLFVAVIKWWSK